MGANLVRLRREAVAFVLLFIASRAIALAQERKWQAIRQLFTSRNSLAVGSETFDWGQALVVPVAFGRLAVAVTIRRREIDIYPTILNPVVWTICGGEFAFFLRVER